MKDQKVHVPHLYSFLREALKKEHSTRKEFLREIVKHFQRLIKSVLSTKREAWPNMIGSV